MNICLNQLFTRPELYKKTETAFWDDEHISKQMLAAHLDPEYEGASRKLEYINRSVSWIQEAVSPLSHPYLLDIGCGPGIYAEKFTESGYHVTGIDFSKRSVEYAIGSANKRGMDITYLYQNYLTLELGRTFDFCTMIYCDYGALPTQDRQLLMEKVYRHLRQGGKFLLDVFSMAKYSCFEEKQTWEYCSDGGFWREKEYLALNGYYKYPDSVTLDQIIVISDNTTVPYYLWNTYFTHDTLIAEASQAGFQVNGIYADVTGRACCPDSPTIALLLEKP